MSKESLGRENLPMAYVAELEELNELKEAGVISDEEFEAKKKQILGI